MELTPRQRDAVVVEDPPRDTCVVAGPGSGKTTVLAAHFESLVENGIDPLRILAITFTEKAAHNMRDKLAHTFQDRSEIRGKLERAYVSTVDGFCTRLLKENAVFAGVDLEFSVMDENDAFREQRSAIDQVLDAVLAEDPVRMGMLLRGLATDDAGSAVLDTYDAIRAAGIAMQALGEYAAPAGAEVLPAIAEARRQWPRTWRADKLAYLQEVQDGLAQIAQALSTSPEAALHAIRSFNCNLNKLQRGDRTYELLKEIKDKLIPQLEYRLVTDYYRDGRAALIEIFERFDEEYRKRKQLAGVLDFGDLEEYAVRVLTDHPEVRRRVRNQFDRVLMDEFQDTNGVQAKLMDLLRTPDRFYAVGDINQSIYGFRHANPEVFREYRDDVLGRSHRVVELVENFRSRQEILSAIQQVTGGASGIEHRPLVKGLEFADKATPSVEAVCAETIELEAQWIAARIRQLEGSLALRKGTAQFRDMAVLVRNSEVLADFTPVFDAFGIPFLVNRGKGFYESREIVDLMHLLRVIANPRDEISMATVLRSPFVGASEEALLRLKLIGNLGAALEALTQAQLDLFAAPDKERISRFRDSLAGWRAIRNDISVDRLLLRALDDCGYWSLAGPRETANIEKFVAQARAASSGESLEEFVEEIGLRRASKPREPDAPPEDAANAVRIMTVHAAKGLEFPIVFLAAMHKGVDGDPGAIGFSPHVGLGARWRHPLGRSGKDDTKDDSFQHAIREEMKRRENEESNRLLYVAMSRAEEHLALSFTATGKKPQNWAAMIVGRLPVRSVTEPPERPGAVARAESPSAPVFLDRPAITGQYESQATVTSIAMFADCPRRYYLSRYLGVPGDGAPQRVREETAEFPATAVAADAFGLQVHALLAGTFVESPDPEAAMLASQFHKSQLGRRAAAATSVEREFDFLMEIEQIVLRGQIDLWFEENGKTVLVDYKTDRVTAQEVSAHAARYTSQLRLYGLALQRMHGRPPDEAYIYYLRPNVAVPVDLRPCLFDSPERTVRDFREAQERQEFPLNEGGHCRTCPHFRGLCPAPITSAAPAFPIPA